MKECSKSIARRLRDPGFMTRYFRGYGVDIGGAPDPLVLYQELFPLVAGIRTWDRQDGDAQHMAGVHDDSFDFVHSSHCLEHLEDPRDGLRNWLRVVRPGGHVIITVPDEDLYEQGVFPSSYNADHRWTFTLWKRTSWSARSRNVVDLVREVGESCSVVKMELLDSTYRYAFPRYDQSLTPVGECSIEFVLRKRLPAEVAAGGRRPDTQQPHQEIRIHLNQYRDDLSALKALNGSTPPFRNGNPI